MCVCVCSLFGGMSVHTYIHTLKDGHGMNQFFTHSLGYDLFKVRPVNGPQLGDVAADCHSGAPALIQEQGSLTEASAATEDTYFLVVHDYAHLSARNDKESTSDLTFTIVIVEACLVCMRLSYLHYFDTFCTIDIHDLHY